MRVANRLTARVLVALMLIQGMGLQPSTVEAARPNRGQPSVAEKQARNDRPVEVPERRTLRSKTFKNPDGTFSTEVYAKSIHFQDASGQLQPIQNALVSDPGKQGLRNAANRYKATLANRSENEILTFEHKGRSLALGLEGARPQLANWAGNKLTYAEILERTDLSYTLEDDFVKEEIILKEPVASPSYAFVMQLNGVRMDKGEYQTLLFRDKQTDEIAWVIPQMFMRDQAGVRSGAIAVDAKVTGNKLSLKVTPDEAWLSDPARVYPVVIDPTIALQPDSVAGLDTTIGNTEGLQDINLGFDSALTVGDKFSSLLKFDLAAIPRASAIVSASLQLSSISGAPVTNTTGIPTPTAAPTLTASTYSSAYSAGTYSVRYTYLTPQGETLPSPATAITISNYQAIDAKLAAFPAGVTGAKFYLGTAGAERLVTASDLTTVTLTALPDANAVSVPTIPTAAPTVSASTSGSVQPGTYSVLFTYVSARGESQSSPAGTVTLSSWGGINVNVGTLPTGTTEVRLYVGLPGDERYYTKLTVSSGMITSLPSGSAARPPDYNARFVTAPTAAPTATAVAAPAGSPGFMAGTYQVRYTYLNSMGETTPSPSTAVTLADGQGVQVTVGKLPVGVTAANIYIGSTTTNVQRLGTRAASQTSTPVAFGTPPTNLFTPPPLQVLAVIPDPQTPPTVEQINSNSPFVEGTYEVVYTFFSPNGESVASPAKTVSVKTGELLKVTAGQAMPVDATGMRVYMGIPGGSRYLVGTLSAAQADSSLPWLTVKTPVGYRPIQPPVTDYQSTPAPGLRAVDLTAPTRLEGATYYVRYHWVFPDRETYDNSYSYNTVTIKDDQGIEVIGGNLPTGALGMRVYMGRNPNNLWLAATSFGNRAVIQGDAIARVAPTANTTALPAPAVDVVTLSSLPSGIYSLAYTLTTETAESAPSPLTTVAVQTGQKLSLFLPSLPANMGANLYMGTDPANLQLVRGVTSQNLEITALPQGGATPLSQTGRGDQPPAAPTSGPGANAVDTATLGPGTLSVLYNPRGNGVIYQSSPATTVTVGTGQAISVRTPEYLPGAQGVDLYVGPSGGERSVIGTDLGKPSLIKGIGSDAPQPPREGLDIPTRPTVTSSAGGSLTGDVYLSYSFYGDWGDSLRSPEVVRTFAAPNGTAVLTTAPVAGVGSTGVRVYVGSEPNEARLYGSFPAAAGTRPTINIGRFTPSGIAMHPVVTPWTELNATWLRSNTNTLWYQSGGDYGPEIGLSFTNSTAKVTADLTSLVRQWADGSLPNQGLLLKGTGVPVDFASSDHPNASLRPVLTITYKAKMGAPRVQIVAPANGSTQSGEVQLAAQVTTPDPGTIVERVDFYVNNALVGSDTTAPYSLTWSPTNLPSGRYTVEAKAYDQWGQEGSSSWQMLLSDPFESSLGLVASPTAKFDQTLGLYTLPIIKQAITVQRVSASSEKAAESYPAENMLDGKPETFWRSGGQITPNGLESIRFDLAQATSYAGWTITPQNPKDGLIVKAQAIDSTGEMIRESESVQLDGARTLYLNAGKTFNSIRLVFTNLKRDLASGRYHAEVKEVSGATLKPVDGDSYRATYEATNATDTSPTTSWVSAGQASSAGQEFLELTLAPGTNAFYIKPRSPGLSVTFAEYKGPQQGWEPVHSITSLDEGLYPLPGGISPTQVRLYFTNLVGLSGPTAPSGFFAGVDQIIPYKITLSKSEGYLTALNRTLSEPTSRFLLEVEDSQPPGSSISYQLYDGVTWRSIMPGIEQTLPAPTSVVALKATLATASPYALPALSSWKLFAHGSSAFDLETGVDTIPPTAELVYPPNDWLSGTVNLDVATWDNVGVTRVDLYVDTDVAPAVTATKAAGDATPYTLPLDTTKYYAGKHMLWVKAYDAAGNQSGSTPPTTTYTGFTDTFNDADGLDPDLSDAVLVSGAVRTETKRLSFTKNGTATVSQSFVAGPGVVTLIAPGTRKSNGACASGTIQLKLGSSLIASDQILEGECRVLRLTHQLTSTGTYTVDVAQNSTEAFTIKGDYAGQLSASTPYVNTTVISQPTVTAGPLAGVTLTATSNRPTGTAIDYYVSANDGITWQSVTPGLFTRLNHGGGKLRLRADLRPAIGASSTFANVTPELLDWKVDVQQYLPKDMVTMSQLAPPSGLTASLSGTTASLNWTGSSEPGVTYNIYRSRTPHPTGEAYLVASGVPGTSLVEGNNLLRGSSFEAYSGYWGFNTWWGTLDTEHVVAGLRSLKISDPYGYGYSDSVSQWVPVSKPAGTTFTLSTHVRGESVVETAPTGMSLVLYYTDGTTSTVNGGLQGGTFDWTTARVSFTATKPVYYAYVTLQLNGRGTLWFDAVELDTVGAPFWNLGELEANSQYYYLVTAVDAMGRESAPSNEASTAATTTAPSGKLGIKGFWPYAGLELPGGSGYLNLASGNMAYAATDLVYPSRLLAMAFRRTYNHQGAAQKGPLGYGWDHSFNWRLFDGAGGARILKEGDGATFTFNAQGDGKNYVTPPGARMRLVRNSDGTHSLVRYDNNLLYLFGTAGQLVQVAEPNGNALSLTYDGSNRLAQVTDPAGQALTFTYNAAGQMTKVTHPGHTTTEPRAVSFEYDSKGNLVQVVDLEANSTYYGYDEQHRLVQVTDALGRSTQVAYTGQPGVVSKVIYPDAKQQAFAFGAAGDQSGWTKSTVTDARGFSVGYQVDGNGLLKRQSFPFGTATPTGTQTGTVSFEHDAAWNVTKVTDPRNGVTAITYDGFGQVLTLTDALGGVTKSLWAVKPHPLAGGQVLVLPAQVVDARGNTSTLTTDGKGNLTQVQDALLQVTEYTYDQFGQRESVLNANGDRTSYTYDQRGWLLTQIDPLGGTVRFTYDAGGNPQVITDPVKNQTRYTYDRLGRLVETTFADGSRAFALFDGVGNVVQATDAAGAMTRFTYDTRNRVVKQEVWPNADDEITKYATTYEYDAVGLPLAAIDARGKRTSFVHDGSGRQLSVTNPLGQVTRTTYDAAGNVTLTSDPLNHSATAEYDALNRRTKSTVAQRPGQNMTQTVSYDVLGRMTSQKDALGNTTTYHYDAIGQLVTVVDPMGFGTNYAYDRTGNRLAVTDAQRRTTQMVYDEAGRLIEELQPDGTRHSTQYDPAGRVLSTVNGRNQRIGYRYDNRNRVVEVLYPSDKNVRFTYDAVGRRTSMTDPTGTTRYRYNLLGWVQEVENPKGQTVSYAYDPNGNRTQMQLSYTGVSFNWTYGYDDAGQLTSVQSPTVARANTFQYDQAGRMTQMQYANNDTVTYQYNDANQAERIDSRSASAGNFGYQQLTFDLAGRRTSINRSTVGMAEYSNYAYDANSRLATTNSSEFYYDLVGNRHTMMVNNGESKGVSTYVYDATNRLIEEFGPNATSQGGGRYHLSYTYDGDGNQTKMERDGKEVSLYYYDEEGRMLQATNPLGQISRYTYDGDGKRVQMEDPTGKTNFIYDGSEVLAELDATGTIKIAYTRLPGGRLVSQWQGGETFWYHLDDLGSTRAITDESGKVRNRYGYDEFGNKAPGGQEEIFNRFQFTGQAWDASVGLYHYKARYYNPQAGRFLTQDTYKGSPWEPWTQHLYAYVGNNPVNWVDPTGHSPQPLRQLDRDGYVSPASISGFINTIGIMITLKLTAKEGDHLITVMSKDTKLDKLLSFNVSDMKALNRYHYDACSDELQGIVVAMNLADNEPYDHCGEIYQNQKGLQNRLEELQKKRDYYEGNNDTTVTKAIDEQMGRLETKLNESTNYFSEATVTNPIYPSSLPMGLPMYGPPVPI